MNYPVPAGTSLFIQLTRQYEYAWYGGFTVEREQFDAYYRLFTETKQGLR